MSKVVAKRVLYLSSKDKIQVSGQPGTSNHDFFMDLEESVRQMEPQFMIRDPDVRIYATISQLWVPFALNSKGFVTRNPPYRVGRGNALHIPQVHMLRLHTSVAHDNMTQRGHSTIALQIPFMDYYQEGVPNTQYVFSRVSYKEPHPDHIGRFKLSDGLESLSFVRFWITDEGDRLLETLPNTPVYITLTLTAETAVRKRKYNEDLTKNVRELVGLNRLLLVQNEKLRRREGSGSEDYARRWDRLHLLRNVQRLNNPDESKQEGRLPGATQEEAGGAPEQEEQAGVL